ncbi:hypothetical protein [Massilibacteroides sp.]|uniref:hypothetical protein n=1 Tax=Massilibacteroides sp. TaxID=2034766 RepID=UPI00262612E1|nr:hypothetical protein [Massilibacteroides sp.]MDD4516851.1 hypothetical protein [Massilibacteroides sp.]
MFQLLNIPILPQEWEGRLSMEIKIIEDVVLGMVKTRRILMTIFYMGIIFRNNGMLPYEKILLLFLLPVGMNGLPENGQVTTVILNIHGFVIRQALNIVGILSRH